MWIIVITQVLLFAVMSGGWLLGKRIHTLALRRKGKDQMDDHDISRLKEAIAFVSGAVGVMLGLLLSLSVSQYHETQTRIDELGTDSIAIFSATNNFDTEEATLVRQDVVCTLRSFVAQDWRSTGEPEQGSKDQTSLWTLQLNNDVRDLAIGDDKQHHAYVTIMDKTADLANQIDKIQASSVNSIPLVIWAVIFFAAFVLCALLAITAGNRKVLSRLLFGVTYGTQAVILLALTVLDFPLQNLGFGSALTPDALKTTYASLEWQYPGQEWSQCPVLDPDDVVHEN